MSYMAKISVIFFTTSHDLFATVLAILLLWNNKLMSIKISEYYRIVSIYSNSKIICRSIINNVYIPEEKYLKKM